MSDWQWQIATVQRLADGRLSLVFDLPDSCRRCASGQGCGAGAYSRLFLRHHTVLPIAAEDKGLTAGCRVRVGVRPRALVLMALAVYGLPLLAFLGGVLAGQLLLPGTRWTDLVSLIAGLLGTLMIWPWLRRLPLIGGNPRIELLSCTGPGSALETQA